MLILMIILEDVLGYSIPSPIPIRLLSRLTRRLPLPISVQRRAMAIGQWAEEMKKVGAEDDWRSFLGRGSNSSGKGITRSGVERELTRGSLRNRNAVNKSTRGSEEIALLGRNEMNGRFDGSDSGEGSSSKAYSNALRDLYSKAISPITSTSTSQDDPNELSSSSTSKGKKKAKSSLDETLPSTISRSSTPPTRPISPSTASLLRAHAHSPPIRSPLGLGRSMPNGEVFNGESGSLSVDMKEMDPFDSYASASSSSSRRPSHPPSTLATSWIPNHGTSPSTSKRTVYEVNQTPGASPPQSPKSNDEDNRARTVGSVLVPVG